MTMELHPLCTFFPRMPDAEFAALREDIKANGLRQMIVLHDGMILDGSHRYRACIEAGVKPRFIDYSGDNLLAFVRSVNLHRRHMTPGQQAVIVASMQDWALAQARGGDRKSDQSATLHFDSAAGRASESGASLRTQKMADKVVKADRDLAGQVGRGEVSLPAAVAKVEAKAPKKPKKVSPPADTGTVATPPERHDEAPGPVEVVKDADSPKVTDLMAEIASLKAANAALTEEVEALREVAAGADETLKELVLVQAIVDANPPLAEAVAKAKQLSAEVFSLRESNRALQSETNEAIRLCKAAQRRADRLEKAAKEQVA